MDKPRLIPDETHPITVTPTGRRVTVRVGDRLVADTTRALSLAESTYPVAQYIPIDDVSPEVLRESSTETYCPYKGDARYYSLAVGDDEITDAIWAYDNPYPAVAEIAGHVAFYPNKVAISVETA
jgi:uncharacterized protein (DUF427 family)